MFKMIDAKGGLKNLSLEENREVDAVVAAFEAEKKADAARAAGSSDSPAKPGQICPPDAEDAKRLAMIERHRNAWKEQSPAPFPDNQKPPDPSEFPAMPIPPATKQDTAEFRLAPPRPRADSANRLDDAAVAGADGGDVSPEDRDAMIGFVDGKYGANPSIWEGKSGIYISSRYLWARADREPVAAVTTPLDHSKDRKRQDMIKRNHRLAREG
jgi:hypothetical protein